MNADDQAVKERVQGDYSADEIDAIYNLARVHLENGDLRRAEVLLTGLVVVAPLMVPAWLGMAYVSTQRREYEHALRHAKAALKIEPDNGAAMLYLVALSLVLSDYNTAGTYLGAVGEQIELGTVSQPELVRFYRMQLARYNHRE